MRRLRPKTRKQVEGHFERRCLQRLGCTLDQPSLKRMMLRHELPVIRRESSNRTHFLYVHEDGRSATLVYDKLRHSFVTVLLAGKKRLQK